MKEERNLRERERMGEIFKNVFPENSHRLKCLGKHYHVSLMLDRVQYYEGWMREGGIVRDAHTLMSLLIIYLLPP